MFNRTLATNGLIAILRGLRPEEAESIGSALYAAGIRIIEVPLNSPQPLRSLEILRRILPEDCLVGAGTVLSAEQVRAVKVAGGQLIVMPPTGSSAVPGGSTASQAFIAPIPTCSAGNSLSASAPAASAAKASLGVATPGAR